MTHNETFMFNHKPEVLCVAYNQSYNIRVYLKDSQGNYRHVPDHDPKYRNLISVEKMWYIVGPGSCHGDSGGPVFQPALKNGKQIFVILGVTSSGTSNIGHCGGINNPTHYTRVKKISKWITKYVHPGDICWAGKNAEPAPL